MGKDKEEVASDEIGKSLSHAENVVKSGLDTLSEWKEKIGNRFAPEAQKEIGPEGERAFVTLTKMGTVIITFPDQDGARKYYNELTKY